MKTNLILGITGQDGSLMAKRLIDKGEKVIGSYRREGGDNIDDKFWRLREQMIYSKINLEPIELTNSHSLTDLINKIKPDNIFHFAGNSFVSDSFKFPKNTFDINFNPTINLLEACRLNNLNPKILFSISSEIFDSESQKIKTEKSLFEPLNLYGLTKLSTLYLARIYRRAYNMKIFNAIYFNHESPFRSKNFIVRKLVFNLVKLKLFGGEPFEIGKFSTSRNWNSAEEFMEFTEALVSNGKTGDYIFSNGNLYTLKNIIEIICSKLGFDPFFVIKNKIEYCVDKRTNKKLIIQSNEYVRKIDTPGIVGDSSKLFKVLNREFKKDINSVINEMIEMDIKRLKNLNDIQDKI